MATWPFTLKCSTLSAMQDLYKALYARVKLIGAGTGTVAVTNGNAAVTGTNTLFTSEFTVGNYIRVETSSASYTTWLYQIAAIADDTHMTLGAIFEGPTGSGYVMLGRYNSVWYEDPGYPQAGQMRGVRQMRDLLDGNNPQPVALCRRFVKAADLVRYEHFSDVANPLWGQADWREPEPPIGAHIVYHMNDIKDVIDSLTWVYTPCNIQDEVNAASCPWTKGVTIYRTYSYYAEDESEDQTVQETWDEAKADDPTFSATTDETGYVVVVEGAWESVFLDARVVDFHEQIPVGYTAIRARITGQRTLQDAGAAFPLQWEGADVVPQPAGGDPGAMTTLGTSAAAGHGAYDQVFTLSDVKQFVRITNPDWFAANVPHGGAGASEQATLTHAHMGLHFNFAPF